MAELRISGGTIVLPSGSVKNEQIATPGTSEVPIDADKVQHIHKAGTVFDTAIGDTPATREEIVFVASASGVIRGVHALMNDTGTAGNVTLDLKVNGTTVLSSTFTVGSTDADRDVKDGSVSSSNLSAGDVVSISATVAGSDGSGLFAWVEIDENAA